MKKNAKVYIIIGVMLGTLLYSLDQLIVSTAIPRIVHDMNGLSQVSWIFTAYMLTSTITIPLYGKLSDIFGRKRFYILGIVIFLFGSILSGFSQNMTQLIFFRALQGIGGGAMMVNSIAIIGDIFSPRERGKWQGLNMSMYGLATIAGPLLGGWLTDNYSWRWVFYINIPFGIIAIAVIAVFMPSIVKKVKSRSIDFIGSLLITAGLVPFLLAIIWGGNKFQWISWQILILFIVAICAIFGFIFIERKAREPILALNLFNSKVFTISVCVSFLTMIGMYGSIMYIPLFAQAVIGISATNSGIILIPMMAGLILASVISGQIVSRTGKYKILTIAGMVVTVAAMSFFILIGSNTNMLALSWRMVVLGIGLGVTGPIFTTVAQSAFGPERLGEVTAGFQLFKNIGGTVSTAILGGVMNSGLVSKLANIQNEPFIAAIKKLNPASSFTKIDINSIQGFLGQEGQLQIKTMISKASKALQNQLMASFDHFINTIKAAFVYAMRNVYIVSAVIMFIALILVLFLPQITLRKTRSQAIDEALGEVGVGSEALAEVETESKNS